MKTKVDLLLKDAAEVLTCVPTPGDLMGRIPAGSVAVRGERILDVAPYARLAARYDLRDARVVDCTGIVASMRMTRVASEDELFTSARDRLIRMFRAGTTTSQIEPI